jgi:hypothetical protein
MKGERDMGYEIKPFARELSELPKPQAIFIDGVECGECTPRLRSSDELV